MDYERHYNTLIKRAQGRDLLGYTERHHILPRCLGGGDEPTNLVRLTAEEHYVAHQLLIRIYPAEHRLVWAAHLMATRPGNKLYGWLRRRMSAARTGRKQSPEHIAKLAAVRKGRVQSAETIAKKSAALKGYKHSAETCERMAEASKKRGISDETRAKINASLKGKPRKPHSEETKQRIAAAKAANPYRHSDEVKARMAETRKGRKLTKKHRQSIAVAATGRKRGPYKQNG